MQKRWALAAVYVVIALGLLFVWRLGYEEIKYGGACTGMSGDVCTQFHGETPLGIIMMNAAIATAAVGALAAAAAILRWPHTQPWRSAAVVGVVAELLLLGTGAILQESFDPKFVPSVATWVEVAGAMAVLAAVVAFACHRLLRPAPTTAETA